MAYGPAKWNPVPSPMNGPQTGPVDAGTSSCRVEPVWGGWPCPTCCKERLCWPRNLRRPTGPKPPHLTAKAKSCIFLFMGGGPGHMDTFDPKPDLTRHHGTVASGGPDQPEDSKLLYIGSPLSVQQTGKERHRGLRAFPSFGRVGRRNVGGSVSLHRQRQPHRRHPAHEPGPPHAGQSPPWVPGWSMAWAPRTRTCLPLWSCPITVLSTAPKIGPTDICRPFIKAPLLNLVGSAHRRSEAA